MKNLELEFGGILIRIIRIYGFFPATQLANHFILSLILRKHGTIETIKVINAIRLIEILAFVKSKTSVQLMD